MSNVYVLAFATAFIGIIAYSSFNHLFIISQFEYLKIVIITFLLSLLIPIKFYRNNLTISYYEFFFSIL